MAHPARVVSLVPSITELIWWIGCGDRLVGRTRFCDQPVEMVRTVPAMGGTKDPDVAAIVAANPDLVVTNREENRREDVEALQQGGLNVLLTDPNTVAEAVEMIRSLGEALGASARAASLIDEIEAERSVAGSPPLRVLVAVWHRPFMALGAHSYGHDLIEAAGAVNVLRDYERYPQVPLDDAAALRPDLILLPDEPYRFTERHLPAYAAIAPTRIVDGRLIWWYGPRIPEAFRVLRRTFADFRPGAMETNT